MEMKMIQAVKGFVCSMLEVIFTVGTDTQRTQLNEDLFRRQQECGGGGVEQ